MCLVVWCESGVLCAVSVFVFCVVAVFFSP